MSKLTRKRLEEWLRDEIFEARQSDPSVGIFGADTDKALANVLATSMLDNREYWLNLLGKTEIEAVTPVYAVKPIYGFYEEKYPIYSHKWESELQSPATADELNGLVDRLRSVERLLQKGIDVSGPEGLHEWRAEVDTYLESLPYEGGER